ncbi:hypothetical protein A3D84_02555 [Candidatus Woesebacteria bacterium RIFCSPHIGHO2_02_FULL_42_20]|uniref:Uncharacterized protein n=1 Tax=Candidatus Woesebacteria bacterium RIFCSPHIGHO2_12_FULL_41_24 TaxID=1802510 RepID=A0A1F8APJ5_9BACT|nr:MAG: hypothetical protein A2W15_02750 [Candidatus Woesebacteria bacterium RBG_16_41_13]OGM29226.1 MAG: hypothetical protein A2873_03100 [Candidatus Woesebacteria bacterium RIFCSPHIGHO2_01_FULL_42_80]OGM34724.1 MAG: hypothetical protein A3D84_02555 [Candidatus Woesebacteria bacterium RIFCSPHIGHO2_02_FULL_42_20]OGM53687.1 MAG: hypothetical protein A3E44_02285 [Candidatus Woesebacteria bacterium RIFCSPHIGHO2_12_FULL_41_24]OGM67023.1 MAG: hypothetical protein A2969_05750 [Candidatus Woesebacteri
MTELAEITEESVDHFVTQLQADRVRALSRVEPGSTAASVLGDLYPLLHGPLYPRRKSAEIATA